MHKIQNWKKSPLIYQRPLCSAPCNRKYDFGGDRIITVEQPMGRCIITVTWKIDFECDARQCPPIEICFWGQSREMRTGPWTQKLHSLKKRKEKRRTITPDTTSEQEHSPKPWRSGNILPWREKEARLRITRLILVYFSLELFLSLSCTFGTLG